MWSKSALSSLHTLIEQMEPVYLTTYDDLCGDVCGDYWMSHYLFSGSTHGMDSVCSTVSIHKQYANRCLLGYVYHVEHNCEYLWTYC